MTADSPIRAHHPTAKEDARRGPRRLRREWGGIVRDPSAATRDVL